MWQVVRNALPLPLDYGNSQPITPHFVFTSVSNSLLVAHATNSLQLNVKCNNITFTGLRKCVIS